MRRLSHSRLPCLCCDQVYLNRWKVLLECSKAWQASCIPLAMCGMVYRALCRRLLGFCCREKLA